MLSHSIAVNNKIESLSNSNAMYRIIIDDLRVHLMLASKEKHLTVDENGNDEDADRTRPFKKRRLNGTD